MADVTIWHNPSCSKSRAALELLRERGVQPNVIEYLTHTPDGAELRRVLGLLGYRPRDLVRTGEDVYAQLGLSTVDEDALIDAMVANPVLIERPVVVRGWKAVVGRPPERVLEVLE